MRSGVSGKTDYLVIGQILEDGRPVETGSKFRKTSELNEGKRKENPIEVLNEAEFSKLIGHTGSTGSSEDKEEEEDTWAPPTGFVCVCVYLDMHIPFMLCCLLEYYIRRSSIIILFFLFLFFLFFFLDRLSYVG